MLTAASVKTRAIELGFDLCGIAPASDFPELSALRTWIDRGYAGTMDYLNRTAHRRMDVRNVLPSARSVIVAAEMYNVDRPYSIQVQDDSRAKISRYAWGADYHDVLTGRLERLLEWMRQESNEPFDARAYVDTGPIQERVYAQYAGIGWIGKNTCVINPDVGSWLFLSEIISSLEFPSDAPALDQCGTCTLCLEACPTGAIVEPWVLDSTRCLSYLTIELKGSIPETQREALGTHVYGCDICQEVCPWNARPMITDKQEWMPRVVFDKVSVETLARLTDRELDTALKGSAMRRAGRKGLRRNLAIALENARPAPADQRSAGL